MKVIVTVCQEPVEVTTFPPCYQGGRVTNTSGTLTFKKSFTTTNYIVVANTSATGVSGGLNLIAIPTSASYCTLKNQFSNDGYIFSGWNHSDRAFNPHWYASGY